VEDLRMKISPSTLDFEVIRREYNEAADKKSGDRKNNAA